MANGNGVVCAGEAGTRTPALDDHTGAMMKYAHRHGMVDARAGRQTAARVRRRAGWFTMHVGKDLE
jgi:hypothetical protein